MNANYYVTSTTATTRNDQWSPQPLPLRWPRGSNVKRPSWVFIVAEGSGSFVNHATDASTNAWLGGWTPGIGTAYRHNKYTLDNAVFFDGHVEGLTFTRLTGAQSAPPFRSP